MAHVKGNGNVVVVSNYYDGSVKSTKNVGVNGNANTVTVTNHGLPWPKGFKWPEVPDVKWAHADKVTVNAKNGNTKIVCGSNTVTVGTSYGGGVFIKTSNTSGSRRSEIKKDSLRGVKEGGVSKQKGSRESKK